MDDLINRQAAIDAIYNADFQIYDGDWAVGIRNYMTKEEACAIIDGLPSAQHRGKWIRNNDSDHAWKCSVCGCGYTDYRLNYCYDCGAEMKGEEDETG